MFLRIGISFLSILFLQTICISQEDSISTDSIYKNLLKWIFKRLRYPMIALKNKTPGQVISSFVVNKDGSVSDIQILKSSDILFSREALQLIQLLKKEITWSPAQIDGNPVRYKCILPIKFKIGTSISGKANNDMFLVFKAWGGREVFRGMVSVAIQDAIPGKYIKNIETYDIPKSKAVYNVIGSANLVHFRPKKLARPQELIDLKPIIMDNMIPKGLAARYNEKNDNLILTLGKVEKPLKLYIHNYIGEVFIQENIKKSNGHIEKIDISKAPEGVLFVSLASSDEYASVLVVKGEN